MDGLAVLEKDFEKVCNYLKENNRDLYDRLFEYLINGIGKDEILLEVSLYVSFEKELCRQAMEIVRLYEIEAIGRGNDFPFITNAIKENICRNMVTVQSNSSCKRLYAILMDNDTVKIGIATDTERRFSQIKSSSGMEIKEAVYTEVFEDAKKEETNLHRKYKKERLNGEYFDIPYDFAKKELELIASERKIALIYK